MAECSVCFRHCHIPEGGLGFCGGRTAKNGKVEAFNYGRITSLALDPIEKKPLARFHPGHADRIRIQRCISNSAVYRRRKLLSYRHHRRH